MEINERTIEGVTILDIKGKITLGDGDEMLRLRIRRLRAEGNTKIIINLGDCPYIDSAGLAEISNSFVRLSREGGRLKLLALTKRIQELLTITKLLSVFEVFDSETAAIASFK